MRTLKVNVQRNKRLDFGGVMKEYLSVVQGDRLELDVIINSEEEAVSVSEVFFSCQQQGIIEKMTKIDDKTYHLILDSDKTEKYVPGITSFDITLKFIDGGTLTSLYQKKFQVLRKVNKIG